MRGAEWEEKLQRGTFRGIVKRVAGKGLALAPLAGPACGRHTVGVLVVWTGTPSGAVWQRPSLWPRESSRVYGTDRLLHLEQLVVSWDVPSCCTVDC